MRTIAQLYITVDAGVTGRAATCVRSLPGVEAGTAITTRLMIRTVIEILIAEQSSPTLVAETVPRLDAGTVYATWVTFAFVAVSARPTAMASVTFERGRKEKLINRILGNVRFFFQT